MREKGEHVGTKRRRGYKSPGPGGALAGIQWCADPRTNFCRQPSCFLPCWTPSCVSIPLPTLTPHPTRTKSNGAPHLSPLRLLPTGEDGLSGPLAICHLGLLSPAGSQGPTPRLARPPFPAPHASRPCRSLRSRARSCLKKPRLGMMPRWSLTFLMASTRVRRWYSMR